MYPRRELLKTVTFGIFSTLFSGANSSTSNSRARVPKVVNKVSFERNAVSTGWLPIDLSGGRYIVLPAKLNGIVGEVILDSGVATTVLDRSLAAKLGLQAHDTFSAIGITGLARGVLADGLNIAIGNMTIQTATTSIFDLSGMSAITGRPITAILGGNIFDLLVVDIDFANSRVTFNKPNFPQAISGNVHVSLRENKVGLREIPLSIEGGQPVQAVFDLGSDTPLYLSPEYAATHDLFHGKKTSTSLSAGIEGTGINRVVVLHTLKLGQTVLHGVPVEVPQSWTHASPAFVGLPVLSRFQLVIDFGRNDISMTPDQKALLQPFRKDRSGVGAVAKGNALEIVHIAVGSPAEHAGLRIGDEIVAINGRKIDSEYFKSRSREGSRAAGTILNLTLKNGTHVVLTLTDYY